jgi:DHA3 family tetracycline resistance protein-like MFS transporter
VRIETRAVYLAMTAVLSFGSGLIMPAYVVYYVRTAGLGPLELVLVGTALEASYFLSNVPTGAIADSYGRRWAIVLGVAVIGGGWLLQGLIPVFAFILIAEAVRGIGEAFMDGATDAWIADEVGDGALPELFARAAQLRRLTYLGGLGGSVLLATISYAAPIVAGAAVNLVVAVALVFELREPAFRRPTERRSWRAVSNVARDSASLVRRRPFLLTLFATSALFGAASEGFDRLADPHLLTLLPAAIAPVTAFALIDVVATAVGIGMAEIARRTAHAALPVLGPLLAVGEACRIVAIVVFALASGFPLAISARMTKTAIQGLTQPLYHAWLMGSIEPRVRATVLSMHSLCNAGGQITGGPFIGAVGSLFSIPAALVSGSLFLVPNVFLYLRAGSHARAATVPVEATP